MNATVAELVNRIRAMEQELEAELALLRADLHVRVEDGKIEFEKAVLERHRRMKSNVLRYIIGSRPLIVLTAPFIYALIVPVVLLDLFMTVYQGFCFPVYGIEKVRRSDYLIFDRRYLAYLNLIEKINCGYCSYANGVIAYAREIASRTEEYWCPIKHARKVLGAHPRYSQFVDYGDAEGFARKLEEQNEETDAKRGR